MALPGPSSTILVFGDEARASLLRGMNALNAAVSTTLGPKGRNVLISNPFLSTEPKITKDGVTVARTIHLPGIEGIGANLLKSAAIRTNEKVGDGTTTSTLLGASIVGEGLKSITAGVSTAGVRRGIERATADAIAFLRSNARRIKSSSDILNIATISANNDKSIGRLIAEAFEKVGTDGIITIGDGSAIDDSLNITEGCQLDRGWLSPYFLVNSQAKAPMTSELRKPYVLVTDEVISSAAGLVPIMQRCVDEARPLLVIAADVTGDALTTLTVNHLKGVLSCCAIRAPGYGDVKTAYLEDISCLLGIKGFVSSTVAASPLEERLGTCERAVIGKDATVLFTEKDGAVAAAKARRIQEIKSQLADKSLTNYQRDKMTERIGKLLGKVAVLSVGGTSDVQVQEKRDRYTDALSATRAAIKEGYLPGGGVALARAAEFMRAKLAEWKSQDAAGTAAGASAGTGNKRGDREGRMLESDDEVVGYNIVISALSKPCITICENAGTNGHVVLRDILQSKSFFHGFDAFSMQYGDLERSGVIDPCSVAIAALESASSVAMMTLTTEAVVTEAEKESK